MKKTNRLIYLSIILAAVFTLFGGSQAWAANIEATGTGNWSNTSSWVGGVVPTSADDVWIPTSATITIDGDYTVSSMSFTEYGQVKPSTSGTRTLTVTGDILSASGVTGNYHVLGTNSNGKLNVIVNATTAEIDADGTENLYWFNDLDIYTGSTVTTDAGWKIGGDLTLTDNSSLTQSSGTVTITGATSAITVPTLGTLSFKSVALAATATGVTTASTFAVTGGYFTLTSGAKFNASAGTITLTAPAAGSVSPINGNSTASDLTFNNLTLSTGSGTFTPASSYRVIGNFTESGAGAYIPTAGTLEFDNNASKYSPKTITVTSASSFYNLKLTDQSNVKTASSFEITGNAGSDDLLIEGTGAFVSTGSVTFTQNADVNVSNSGVLQLNNVFATAGATLVSSTNMTLTGNFTIEGNGSAIFSSPSIVAFKDTTGATGSKTITQTGTGTLTLNSLYVLDDLNQTSVGIPSSGVAANITLKGDIKVYGNSSLDLSMSSGSGSYTIVSDGSTTKNIYNEGTLTFYKLTAGSGDGNFLTESDFTIEEVLDCSNGAADGSTGSFVASGNSIITFAFDGMPFVNATDEDSYQFQSIKVTGALVATACEITIKGDLIVGSGGSVDMDGAATLIKFGGTSEQKIIGNVAALDKIVLDNSAGLVLEGNIVLLGNTTTADCLTLTNGDLDLNGNYYIQLDDVACDISEAGGYVKNTKPGTGYIQTASGCSAAEIVASNIGVGGNLGTADALQVKRLYGIRKVNGLESITRYYYIDDVNNNGAGNAVTFAYATDELNGITEGQLTAYFCSGTPDANEYSGSLTDIASKWVYTNGLVTTASNIVSIDYGTLRAANAAYTTGYWMVAPAFIELSYFPTTSIEDRNKNAESPLIAGSTAETLLTFKMETTKDFAAADVFSALSVDFNRSPSGIFSTYILKKDANNDVSDYTLANPTGGAASGSLSGNSVLYTSLGEDLSAGTAVYYFVQANVDPTVNSSTPTIFASIDQDAITANNLYKVTQTINGPTYSFGNQSTVLSSANSPSAGAIDIGTTGQTVYGFKLKPPTGSSVTFNSVNVKVTFENGAVYNDFENWKLYVDDNKNGIFDTGEELVGSNIATIDQTTGILTFTEDVTLVAGEDMNFILITSVKSSATANGTIKAQITSNSDVTLASPATVPSGGPYQGNTMTVRSSSGTATKLSITAFSMKTIDGNSGRDYDLKAKGENEVVDDEALVIQVKAVDANGRPQKVSTATTVTLTPLGGGTITNGTVSISINATTGLTENLTFSSASTANDFSLIAATTSGMSLTADTLTGIKVFSLEPTAFDISALAAGTIQATTATLSWTNGGANNVLVVMKEGSWPTGPEDGVTYNSSANFGTPASSNGTTGTGSVVVYKGSGTSVNLTGLTASKTYYVKAYLYTGSGIGTNYLTWDVVPGGTYNSYGDQVQFNTKNAEPTVASANIAYSDVTASSMKISWDKPTSGGGTYSLVVMGTADPSTAPTDTTTYTASTVYSEGTALGTTGFVVYNGTGNTVTVTGLSENTQYYYRIYEFNGSTGKENYLAAPYLSGSRYTLDVEPTIQTNNISFSDMALGTNTSVRVNFVRGNGDNVLVVGKAGTPIGNSELPTDQSIAYTSETAQAMTFGTTTAIGQGYVLYVGTANNITVSGLQYGQTYYFRAFEYNSGTPGTNTTTDNSQINYLTSTATNNPSSRIADSYEPNDDLADAKFVASDGTLTAGLLTSADDADWFSFRPDFENSYDNIRIKLTGLPKNYTLELYRADGRLLRRSKIVGTADEIVVLNNLPEADYYVKIYSADGEYSLTPYRVNILNRTTDYQSDTQ